MIMAIEHSGIAINSDVIKTKLLDMSSQVGSTESEVALRSKSKGKVGRYQNQNNNMSTSTVKKNELIGKATLQNGVYKLNTLKSEKVLAAAIKSAEVVQWHRRLGHVNSNDLQKMKNGAVEGVSYDTKADIQKSNCEVCLWLEIKRNKIKTLRTDNGGVLFRYDGEVLERVWNYSSEDESLYPGAERSL
ncbi:hypothetical protein EVAR_76953_1 [Eumeta japonica]|uniref:GAG-pre-integrase domain-containing protein n=1 Tax=Eumeta variegata TaxID=151549 RepID=A0A4C1SHW6_EUMVA|nr:hypothetical protein EVAR_76953_1 [Eumeta japonica]